MNQSLGWGRGYCFQLTQSDIPIRKSVCNKLSLFSNLSLVYHRSVCMNNLPGANLFSTSLLLASVHPCQLSVDIFPCLVTPEHGNMS